MIESRKDPRIPVKLRVLVKDMNGGREFYTINASRGGVFLGTDSPGVMDEIYSLEIYLSESSFISARGKVVWVSYPHADSSYVPGMGIKFFEINLMDLQKLGKFLGDILKSQREILSSMDYDIGERMIVTTEDIFAYPISATVALGGRGIREVVKLTEEIINAGGEYMRINYENFGEDLAVGESLLIPSSGDLKSSHVLLTGVPAYYDSYGEEQLRTAILAAIRKASEQVLDTIAIPAFSILELGFPIKVAARVMLATIYGFLRNERYPRKVFFFCNYFNENDLLLFENTKREILSD